MKPFRILCTFLALSAAMTAQAGKPPSAAPLAPAGSPAVHLAIGQVLGYDAGQRLLTVAHQDIPSLRMPAMTMDFLVHGSVDASRLAEGQTVAFVLAPVNGNLTVTALQPVAEAARGPGTKGSLSP